MNPLLPNSSLSPPATLPHRLCVRLSAAADAPYKTEGSKPAPHMASWHHWLDCKLAIQKLEDMNANKNNIYIIIYLIIFAGAHAAPPRMLPITAPVCTYNCPYQRGPNWWLAGRGPEAAPTVYYKVRNKGRYVRGPVLPEGRGPLIGKCPVKLQFPSFGKMENEQDPLEKCNDYMASNPLTEDELMWPV